MQANGPNEREMVAAWRRRDAGYDGVFVLGVKTTGICCRPSCPSQPKRQHLEFFHSLGEAVGAGYRPCKRCAPERVNGQPPPWVARLIVRVAEEPDRRWSARDLRAMAIAPERARRWFRKNYGLTFAAWARGLRLAHALTRIHRGAPLDDVVLSHGFESHSGFRTAFQRAFGRPPGRATGTEYLRVVLIETPLGPMLAAASDTAVCQLEFADPRVLERSHAEMRRRLGLPLVPGPNAVLDQLQEELAGFFHGSLRSFSVPASLQGSSFQERAWRELQQIPFGETVSYAEVARRMGAPAAVRAVARANATNRLYLLVPCHRVIAQDGSLSGYGGGVWRKRLLLELERTGRIPGATA